MVLVHKISCPLVGFVVTENPKVKLKEIKKRVQLIKLLRKPKELWGLDMSVITITDGTIERIIRFRSS